MPSVWIFIQLFSPCGTWDYTRGENRLDTYRSPLHPAWSCSRLDQITPSAATNSCRTARTPKLSPRCLVPSQEGIEPPLFVLGLIRIAVGYYVVHGVISAKNLDTDPTLPWKRKPCVLAQDGRPVVFWQQTLRSEFQVGLYATRQDFISACLGDDLAAWGNFPVWIFDRFGKCFLHPVTPKAVFEESPDEKNEGENSALS